jgi:hypothetical protein
VNDIVEAGFGLFHQLAEARPFFPEFGGVMRGGKLLRVGLLHIIDDVAAVLAAMQVHRDEPRLGRHETGALNHQVEDFVLLIGRQLDRGNLRANSIAFANLGHFASSWWDTRITHGRAASFARLTSPRRIKKTARRPSMES